MRVDIRHDEIDLLSSSSPSVSRMPVRPHIPPAPDEYVPTIAQFPEGSVHFPLYKGRGTACAGAEIDEGVVGDGWAEDGLERAGDDGGRGCGLQDWGFVCPEESETCLDEGAERSGKPEFGSLVLAVRLEEGGMGWGWRVRVPGLVVDFEKTERGDGQREDHSCGVEGLVDFIEDLAPYVSKCEASSNKLLYFKILLRQDYTGGADIVRVERSRLPTPFHERFLAVYSLASETQASI